MYHIISISVIILIIVYLLCRGESKEQFALGKNYSIRYNNSDKNVEIYNIVSKIVGDKVSGLKFNGIDSYMRIPDISLNKYTLTFIIKFDNVNKSQTLISNGWELMTDKGLLTVVYKNETVVLEKTILPNEFVQIAVMVANNDITLFLDGIQLTKTFKNKIPSGDILIGKGSFKGIIGEIALFTEIKNTKELCDMYDSCNIRGCSFIANGATRNDCYKNCMDNADDDCGSETCANKCYNKDISDWKPPCEFTPYGSDIFSCMNHCSTKKSCNYGDCQKLCQECKNTDTCPWAVNEYEEETNPYVPELPPDIEGRPTPPKIKVTPYNGKLLIEWLRASPTKPKAAAAAAAATTEAAVSTTEAAASSAEAAVATTASAAATTASAATDASGATTYVCVMFKTLNKKEGVNLSMVPYPNCKKCSFVVDNLKEDEFYSVGIRGYNKNGLGRISNIVSMLPKFKVNPEKVPTATNPPVQNVSTNHYCNAKN
jgi:hypothetical protein